MTDCIYVEGDIEDGIKPCEEKGQQIKSSVATVIPIPKLTVLNFVPIQFLGNFSIY